MQQQTIAILGATSPEGVMIATGLAKSRNKLLLWNKDGLADTQWMAIDLQKHFPQADVEAIACNKDASWEADLIIAAIPHPQLAEVCDHIKEVANRKILVHVSDAASENTARLCADLLPHTQLVNVITEWSGTKSIVFVQSNEKQALATVIELLEESGITPVTSAYNVQLERA